MMRMRSKITDLAKRHGVATIAGSRIFAAGGCLMSYDASLADSYRQAGAYVARILQRRKAG